jgi:hypothetical protein
MNKCQHCDKTTALVMSGTDAFMLGVEVATYCYVCAPSHSSSKPSCEACNDKAIEFAESVADAQAGDWSMNN